MASAGFDCQLLIWDLEEETVALEMESLPQPVRQNNTYLQYKTTHTLYGKHIICKFSVYIFSTVTGNGMESRW